MSFYSQADATPAGEDKLEGWAINVPHLWSDKGRVQLKGGLPSYHPVIHFIGYAGVARTALVIFGPFGQVSTVLTYIGCIVIAVLTGRMIQNHPSERLPRICSAILGLVGLVLAAASSQLSMPHGGTPNIWTSLVVPLSAAGLIILANLAGEALTYWCPRKPRPPAQPPDAGAGNMLPA